MTVLENITFAPIPDTIDISRLEHSILEIAPSEVIAWNRRNTEIYSEPRELVDLTLLRLKWDKSKLDAIKRQQARYLVRMGQTIKPISQTSKVLVPFFPQGEFRFFALDVETANNDRSSICQIGVAGVKMDNSIVTWQTYIDPKTKIWSFTRLHGISANTVVGAPSFEPVFSLLQDHLSGHIVFQHSCFDQLAITAACKQNALSLPSWQWRDSVRVARLAWPELKGNGGHGLASLKKHLNLQFKHHDAEEDARASAQVVLYAEKHAPLQVASILPKSNVSSSLNASIAVSVAKTPIVVTDLNQSMPSMSSTTAPRAKGEKPLPANSIRDAILQKIFENSAICVHPAQKHENGTKYLSAFTSGPFTFVIDKTAASKQPIWVLDQPQFRHYLDTESIQYDEYPSNKGRNSNLHKIPNFKTGALLRIYPSTVEQALLFIAKFGANSV